MEIKMSDSKSKRFSDMFRDNKEVVRLVIECVVLVGIFYYFNKKISKLSKHIEEISQKLELQDDLIEKQNFTITELTLNLNSKAKSTPVQQPFFQFEQKEEPKKVKKVTTEQQPKPILKPVPETPKRQPRPAPVPEPPTPVETPRVKFATPRVETPEVDIFQFLHRPQSRPVQQPTQEIEILEGEHEEDGEIEEVKESETEEELLDKELENEMKDLD